MSTLMLVLAALALFGGAVAGAWAALRLPAGGGGRPAFLIWLGLVTAASTTFAESMEALPFSLMLAAAVGVLPFSIGFQASRALLRRLRGPRR